MQINTFKWMRDFNKEINPVRKMFYGTKLPGNLHDYYDIKVVDGKLKIFLVNKDEIPDTIAEALYMAFNNSLLKNNA